MWYGRAEDGYVGVRKEHVWLIPYFLNNWTLLN